MEVGKEYSVAAIMERHNVTNSLSFFHCNNVVKGYYDQKKNIFVDTENNEYPTMDNIEFLKSSNRYAFNNQITTDELRKVFGNNTLSLDKCMKLFTKMCKDEIWISGLLEGDKTYLASVNISNLEKEYDEQRAKVEAHPVTSSEIEKKEAQKATEEGTKKKVPTHKELEDLTMRIIDNKLSKEELIKLKEELSESKDDIDALLLTIDTYLESNDEEKKPDVYVDATSLTDLARSFANQEPDPISIYMETKKEKAKLEGLIDIKKLFKDVTKTVVAQDEPTKRVIAEIARKLLDDRKKREGILLTGDTGVGKTEMMNQIAKHIGRPFYEVDSTQLTVPGYVGKNIEEELWDLYEFCGRSVTKAEQAIICFDEIDKKGSPKKDDVNGKGVLNLLLKFIEGATYDASANVKGNDKKVKINTSNMIVILCGAFTDVYSKLEEKNSMGFTGNVSNEKKKREATIDDFVNYAMMPEEFMGRVTVIRLNSLDVDSLKRIIKESDKSALKIQEDIFGKLGVKLTTKEGLITRIAEEAEKKKTGARGINGIIDQATWKAFEDAYSNQDTYEEIILDESVLENPENYQKVLKKKNEE